MATEYTDFNGLKRLTAGMSDKDKFRQIQLALPGADFKTSYYVHKPLGDRVFPHLVDDETEISRLEALDWSRAEVVPSQEASGTKRSHVPPGGGQIYNEQTAGSFTEQMTLPDGTVVERKRPHPDEIMRRAVAVQRQRPAGSSPPKPKGATKEQRAAQKALAHDPSLSDELASDLLSAATKDRVGVRTMDGKRHIRLGRKYTQADIEEMRLQAQELAAHWRRPMLRAAGAGDHAPGLSHGERAAKVIDAMQRRGFKPLGMSNPAAANFLAEAYSLSEATMNQRLPKDGSLFQHFVPDKSTSQAEAEARRSSMAMRHIYLEEEKGPGRWMTVQQRERQEARAPTVRQAWTEALGEVADASASRDGEIRRKVSGDKLRRSPGKPPSLPIAKTPPSVDDAYRDPHSPAFQVVPGERPVSKVLVDPDLGATSLDSPPHDPQGAGRERTKAAQAAAMIRGELRRRGIKARVKSSNFSQGDSVDVYATDLTPEQREGVEKFISQFRYGDFDGRTDSYNANNRRKDIPQAKYVDLTPEYSDQLQQQAWGYFRQQRNVDAPADLKEAERQGGRIDGEPASTWVWQVLQDGESDFWSRSKADASVTPAQGGGPLPDVAESPAPEARPRRRQSESAQAAAMVRAEMKRRGINGSVSTNRIGNIHIRTTDVPPDEVARLERFSQEFQREHYDAENDYWVPRSRDDIPQGGLVSAANTPSPQMQQRVWSYIRNYMGLDAPEDYNEALEARTQYNDLWPQQYVHMVFSGRQLNFWRQGEVSEVLDGRIPPTLGNPYYGRHIYQNDPALLGDRVGEAGPDVGDDSSSASAEPLEPPPPPLDTMDQGPAVDADAAVDEVADRIQDQQDSADPPASIEPVEEPEPEIDPPVSNELADPALETAETEAAAMPEPEADDATPAQERPIEADEPTPDEPVQVERAERKPRARRPRQSPPAAETAEDPEAVADPGDVSDAESASIEAALEVLRRRRDKPVDDPAESAPASVPTPTRRERPSAMETGRRKKKKGKGKYALSVKHGRAFVQYKRQGDTFVRE